ncbi:hypothetical protein CK203_019100 [Vitis vinifera]|uniref:Auxin-responsive protein SAUR32 n=1 Tax=Vitis vinifera TaxID=29760 RepID=A0A438J7V4_VITVI|nr:hypothetical protein CK203_019100 [Vitis vinifera]
MQKPSLNRQNQACGEAAALEDPLPSTVGGEDVDCNSISSVAEGENVMIKGYFSVLAMGNGEPKKFLVALNYLAYPPFVKLLEAAEQEFGFDQQGVLAVPCEASELQRILSGKVNYD